jgi:Fe2+ transport system protein FeoA
VEKHLIPLASLAAGESAEIHSVVGKTDRTRRLEEIGLRQGARVEMLQSGSPSIVRVNGCKLCFRDSSEAQVFVRTGDAM